MYCIFYLLFCLLIFTALFNLDCFSQLRVTIPWSSSVNVTFGEGKNNPGSPLSVGATDFIYTKDFCPAPGEYSVVNIDSCFKILQHNAGHIFFGPHPLETDSGYMMLVNYQASTTSKTVFIDTVNNLCSSSKYLFWAGIREHLFLFITAEFFHYLQE